MKAVHSITVIEFCLLHASSTEINISTSMVLPLDTAVAPPHPVPDPSIQLSYIQEGKFLLAAKILPRNLQSIGWIHKHKLCRPKYKQKEQSTKSTHSLNLSILVSFPFYTTPKTIKEMMTSSTSAFFPDPPLSFPKRSN